MRGRITFWDSHRGFGLLRPENTRGFDLSVSTALVVESGLGQPSYGMKFDFDVRLPRNGRVEPFNFEPDLKSAACGPPQPLCTGRRPHRT